MKLHLDRVMAAGLPILDGPGGTRGVGVPLAAGSEVLGAIQLQTAASAARLGTATLDLLVLLGRHAAVALRRVGGLAAGEALTTEDLLDSTTTLREARRIFESRLVSWRLGASRGNIAAAARSLDMDRGQLSRLLKRHGIDKKAYREGR